MLATSFGKLSAEVTTSRRGCHTSVLASAPVIEVYLSTWYESSELTDEHEVGEALLALLSDDPEIVDAIIEWFEPRLQCQLDVSPFTAAVVPYLVAAAALATHRRDWALRSSAFVADTERCGGAAMDEVRSALSSQLPTVTQLLKDPDARVRGAAAEVLAQFPSTQTTAALVSQWSRETSPDVRAALLLAFSAVAPEHVEHRAGPEMQADSAKLRLAAATALHRAGRPWPAGAAEVIVDAYAVGEKGSPRPTFGNVVEEFVRDTPDEDVATAIVAALVAHDDPDVRVTAQFAVLRRCQVSRRAPALLTPLLLPVLTGEDRYDADFAVSFGLAGCGRLPPTVVDALAGLAASWPSPAETMTPPNTINGRVFEGRPRDPGAELSLLAKMRDPRWLPLTCRAWSAGYEINRTGFGLNNAAFPLPGSLGECLETVDRWENPASVASGLAKLISSAGRAGAPYAEQLRQLIDLAPQPVAEATVATGEATDDELRAAAVSGSLDACIQLHERGDDTPLLADARARIETAFDRSPWDLDELAPVAPALAPLLPQLIALCGAAIAAAEDAVRIGQSGHTQGRIALHTAQLVWRITGDLGLVRPIVHRVVRLEPVNSRYGLGTHIARIVAELRDPTFEGVMRSIVTDEHGRVNINAVLALIRCGVDLAEFQPMLLYWLTTMAFGVERDTLEIILEVATPDSLTALRHLAERDERVFRGNRPYGGGWTDDLLRDILREAVARLSASDAAGFPRPQGS